MSGSSIEEEASSSSPTLGNLSTGFGFGLNTHFRSILLTNNVGVRIDDQSIEINKLSTNGVNSSVRLTLKEWYSFMDIVPQIGQKVRTFADSIFDHVLNGGQVYSEDVFEQAISKDIACNVSVFKPQDRYYISVSIRAYFLNNEGKKVFKKFPGVTLTQDE